MFGEVLTVAMLAVPVMRYGAIPIMQAADSVGIPLPDMYALTAVAAVAAVIVPIYQRRDFQSTIARVWGDSEPISAGV